MSEHDNFVINALGLLKDGWYKSENWNINLSNIPENVASQLTMAEVQGLYEMINRQEIAKIFGGRSCLSENQYYNHHTLVADCSIICDSFGGKKRAIYKDEDNLNTKRPDFYDLSYVYIPVEVGDYIIKYSTHRNYGILIIQRIVSVSNTCVGIDTVFITKGPSNLVYHLVRNLNTFGNLNQAIFQVYEKAYGSDVNKPYCLF